MHHNQVWFADFLSHLLQINFHLDKTKKLPGYFTFLDSTLGTFQAWISDIGAAPNIYSTSVRKVTKEITSRNLLNLFQTPKIFKAGNKGADSLRTICLWHCFKKLLPPIKLPLLCFRSREQSKGYSSLDWGWLTYFRVQRQPLFHLSHP